MFACSSKRAFSSTMQTACLPRSAASISAGTSGESALVRYTVCLIASTSGVVDGLLDEALDRAGEGIVGVVDEDVTLAHRREDVGLRAVLAEQPGLRDRSVRRVAKLTEPRDADDVPEVAEVKWAGDGVDLALLDSQRVDELLAQPVAHLRRDLEPHDLAESAPAQLLLDRLDDVVGLVGDVVVGIAGDPEGGVIEDLHAGE